MELDKMKLKDKMGSRTWILVMWWMGLLTASLIIQPFMASWGSAVTLPIAVIAGGATAASAGFYAKRSVQENRANKDADAKNV